MSLDKILFWRTKTPADNDWRPRPGQDTVEADSEISQRLGIDLPATLVDVAPFVCGVGGLAHLSQLNSLGWTAPASIFRNTRTMTSMYRGGFLMTGAILLSQATGLEYRNYIPRWSHERERRRDEIEVREHVAAGAGVGLGVWIVRMFVMKLGRNYPFPILEITMGGALADLMFREYWKAHGL